MKSFLVVSVCVLLSFAALPAAAQTKERAAVRAGIKAYNAGKYDLAIRNLLEARKGARHLTRSERAKLHTYLAFCRIVLGDVKEGKKQFKKALDFNSNLELDEASTPPKIVTAFEEARVERRVSRANGALGRSAVAPGWGQFHTDRDFVGYAVIGANVAAVGTAAFRTYGWSIAKNDADKARAATSPRSDLADILDEERQQEQWRNISIGVAAGVWILTAVDAYAGARWYSSGRPKNRSARAHVRVTPAVTPDGGAVFLTATF